MSRSVHLIKIPFRLSAIIGIAKRRKIPARDLDEGYLTHCVLTELWQERAPAPFSLKGASVRDDGPRGVVDIWGYAPVAADVLQKHAAEFGDPELVNGIAGGVSEIHGREIPRFEAGRRVGFTVRACPVVRTKSPTDPTRKREVDAFIAATAKAAGGPVDREGVYAAWLHERFVGKGVTVETVSILGSKRGRLVRRTQGAERVARSLERPDVTFSGNLRIVDADLFHEAIAHGIGRHRAFGFGMLVLTPPGAG